MRMAVRTRIRECKTVPETRVDEQIFERFPGFRRGIVVARMLEQYCGAEVETALLTPAKPFFLFDL